MIPWKNVSMYQAGEDDISPVMHDWAEYKAFFAEQNSGGTNGTKPATLAHQDIRGKNAGMAGEDRVVTVKLLSQTPGLTSAPFRTDLRVRQKSGTGNNWSY